MKCTYYPTVNECGQYTKYSLHANITHLLTPDIDYVPCKSLTATGRGWLIYKYQGSMFHGDTLVPTMKRIYILF